MKTFIPSKNQQDQENYGGEFSILNSNSYKSRAASRTQKSTLFTSVLYLLSILSVVCWIVSLKVYPFGHLFQFLCGTVVLTVNFWVFKWTKS
ncbi:MAG: hypothetical protein IE931_08595 [Sphingobacteriales bacterium]|nr:hypothetical protein [Sphingobacteriales bacterium]